MMRRPCPSGSRLLKPFFLNCYSPNFQGFILMKNALNNQVGMLGDVFLWLVAKLKQGDIYFIKQALPPNISARSVTRARANSSRNHTLLMCRIWKMDRNLFSSLDIRDIFKVAYFLISYLIKQGLEGKLKLECSIQKW